MKAANCRQAAMRFKLMVFKPNDWCTLSPDAAASLVIVRVAATSITIAITIIMSRKTNSDAFKQNQPTLKSSLLWNKSESSYSETIDCPVTNSRIRQMPIFFIFLYFLCLYTIFSWTNSIHFSSLTSKESDNLAVSFSGTASCSGASPEDPWTALVLRLISL